MVVFGPKNFNGRLETFQYFYNVTSQRHHIPVHFCDGHGMKWAIKANIWPKMPKKAIYRVFQIEWQNKTVFMGTKFHKKLIFSAFFSQELATNLRS